MSHSIKLVEEEEELDEFIALVYELFPEKEIELEDDDFVFLAYYGEEVVGFIHLGEDDEHFEIKGFGVKKGIRTDGIEKTLLNESLEQLYGKPVHIRINSLNPSVNFYSDCGFFLEEFGGNCTLAKKEIN